MIVRKYWQGKIEEAWRRKSVVWLSGLRRAGKTVLAKSLPGIEYFDCELPSARRALEDPESFLKAMRGRRVVIDEIHRLGDPSQFLKIAADHYPEAKILATGSSTLSASAKFKDTLTGRKASVWLTPMTLADLSDFGAPDLDRRMLQGGLPPYFLADGFPERDLQDWLDDFWAKDVQELFRIERRASFMRFAELLMSRSGGIFEATAYAAPCEISRTTVANYLAVLEATYAALVVRPFSTRLATEIVAAPKVYAADCGFANCFSGVKDLRPSDRGPLWEHVVLNELCARGQSRRVNYWRDKQGHEVDFILPGPVAVECKWSQDGFSPRNLAVFARRYPKARCYAVCADAGAPRTRELAGLSVTFLGLEELCGVLFP